MTKILTILDGFGLKPIDNNNCNALAKMPNFRRLLAKYPWTTLDANGEAVGQEAGLVGNSEVGHMNIGGLKLVPQLNYQITKSSENAFKLDSKLAPNQLIDTTEWLTKSFQSNNRTVHLIGLFSTGTIHSDLRHWAGAIESAGLAGTTRIILHIISDGRDSDRQSLLATWEHFVEKYKQRLKPYQELIFLGSLGGRFYAMDRDNNWERVAQGLLLMLDFGASSFVESHKSKLSNYIFKKYNIKLNNIFHNQSHFNGNSQYLNIKEIFQKLTDNSYRLGKFDENIGPTLIQEHDYLSLNNIQKNDVVWLLNFRADRMKQFEAMLCDINSQFELGLQILTMSDYGLSDYGQGSKATPVFRASLVPNTLAETISQMGKTQLHIAETEKYAHVTYFLNGGNPSKHAGEDWALIPTNKVLSHAQKPEMRAGAITDYILEHGFNKYDYIVVNYANPDMLGHTGDIQAGIESMEFLDKQLGRLIEVIEKEGHRMVLISDHGNIERVGAYTLDGHSLIDTEHNPSAVPMIIVGGDIGQIQKNLEPQLDTKLYEVLKNNLNRDNTLKLEDDQWLTSQQIPTPELPLWLAGVVLLGL